MNIRYPSNRATKIGGVCGMHNVIIDVYHLARKHPFNQPIYHGPDLSPYTLSFNERIAHKLGRRKYERCVLRFSWCTMRMAIMAYVNHTVRRLPTKFISLSAWCTYFFECMHRATSRSAEKAHVALSRQGR